MSKDAENRAGHRAHHAASHNRDWWEIIIAIGTIVLVVLTGLGVAMTLVHLIGVSRPLESRR
jgi:hypothetical protein